MIPLRLSEIRDIVGGTLAGDGADVVVDGAVVTDTREAVPGSLYVARVGEHADGHDYIPSAVEHGAVAALTTRPVDGLPCVVVDDVQAAFVALSRHVVEAVDGLVVIGITGSSGKTSTKDLLAGVLAGVGETVAPVGSLNSEVGVPLTVCRVTPTTRFLIVEMGARGIGHIRYLTEIAPPRIGAVLNVGTAHMGEFGSKEAIARAKSELVAALPAEGVAVLNVDDPAVAAMSAATEARIVGTSAAGAPEATVRATDVTLDEAARATFTLITPEGRAPVTLGLHGAHHVANALTVAAIARECGLSLPDIAAGLGAGRPVSRWRMEVTERPDGVTIVNDAYNANPDSMRAALSALEGMGGQRRTWAVLGSMLELGPDSDAEHAAIGAEAARRGVDRLVVVGEMARPMVDGATQAAEEAGARLEATFVADADAAHDLLVDEITSGDVVLFKSSRDAGLRLLGDRLTQMEVPE